jgi:hypothetical protein
MRTGRFKYYPDFRDRLKSAIQKRDVTGIEALYHTNGVAVAELNSELACWRPFLEEDTKASVSQYRDEVYFKDLSKAWTEWTKQAHAVTTHYVTHLVFIKWSTGNGQNPTMLPLVLA